MCKKIILELFYATLHWHLQQKTYLSFSDLAGELTPQWRAAGLVFRDRRGWSCGLLGHLAESCLDFSLERTVTRQAYRFSPVSIDMMSEPVTTLNLHAVCLEGGPASSWPSSSVVSPGH